MFAGTEIAGTLLIKYLFFLLGLCIALCTVACAIMFLTRSPSDSRGRSHCFCWPMVAACINRMRWVVGLGPLPDDSGSNSSELTRHMQDAETRRTLAAAVRRDMYGRRDSGTPRSGRLWSQRDVPVLHGVVSTLLATDSTVPMRACLGSLGCVVLSSRYQCDMCGCSELHC